jgi:hypothetical protein
MREKANPEIGFQIFVVLQYYCQWLLDCALAHDIVYTFFMLMTNINFTVHVEIRVTVLAREVVQVPPRLPFLCTIGLTIKLCF